MHEELVEIGVRQTPPLALPRLGLSSMFSAIARLGLAICGVALPLQVLTVGKLGQNKGCCWNLLPLFPPVDWEVGKRSERKI